MHYLKKYIIVILFIVTPVISAQENVQQDNPEAIVKQSVAYFAASDWNGVVSLMHPDALADFKSMIWPIFDAMYSQDSTMMNDPINAMFGLKAENGALVEQGDKELFVNFFSGLTQLVPGFSEIIQSSTTDLVGSIPEGDTLLHFVGRTTAGAMGLDLTKLEVISLKKYNGQWRTMLTGDLQGLGAQFQQMLMR